MSYWKEIKLEISPFCRQIRIYSLYLPGFPFAFCCIRLKLTLYEHEQLWKGNHCGFFNLSALNQ